MITTISTFKPTASYPEQAIVLVFDLEGFSKFFSQPDVQEYVPKFINIILQTMNVILNGGKSFWDDKTKEYDSLPKHIHSKF